MTNTARKFLCGKSIGTLLKATPDDYLPAALIMESAKVKMFTDGITQWDAVYATPTNIEADIAAGLLYVAVKEGKIIAHITITEQQEPQYHEEKNWQDNNSPCCIRRLAVAPEYWGRGIGTGVVLAAVDAIRERGYSSIRFDAFQKNPGLQRMIDKAGFLRIGVVQFSKGPYDLCEYVL